MRVAALATVSATLAFAPLHAGCGKSPTSPGAQSSLEIVGPSSVAPGETVQFTLIAHMTDGTNRDLTKEATWRAGLDVSVNQSGLVTGFKLGQARITATYENRYVSKDVVVVPTGTFRLVGKVFEADDPAMPVIDARLEATTGTGVTLVTSTTSNGFYALYGVAGATSIRVSKEGFDTVVETIDVADHRTADLALRLSAPRPNVFGHLHADDHRG
jgi:hypothetical protein